MLVIIFLTFLDLFVPIFTFLVLIRVIASYFADPSGAFLGGLTSITEPVLAPVRKLLPQISGLDLAPLAVFFLLQGLQTMAHILLNA
jgi:YggT family protein